MEKIKLNKRTLRTLSSTEISLVSGAGYDYYGDDDNDDGGESGGYGGGDGEDGPAPNPPNVTSDVCAPKSENCPKTADTKCCPASGD